MRAQALQVVAVEQEVELCPAQTRLSHRRGAAKGSARSRRLCQSTNPHVSSYGIRHWVRRRLVNTNRCEEKGSIAKVSCTRVASPVSCFAEVHGLDAQPHLDSFVGRANHDRWLAQSSTVVQADRTDEDCEWLSDSYIYQDWRYTSHLRDTTLVRSVYPNDASLSCERARPSLECRALRADRNACVFLTRVKMMHTPNRRLWRRDAHREGLRVRSTSR